jgi:hypothetical protein
LGKLELKIYDVICDLKFLTKIVEIKITKLELRSYIKTFFNNVYSFKVNFYEIIKSIFVSSYSRSIKIFVDLLCTFLLIRVFIHFSVLPKPRQQLLSSEQQNKYERKYDELTSVKQRKQPPPYGQRSGWKPRTQEDFGSGGAFPEIHVAQYPLDMGRTSTVSICFNIIYTFVKNKNISNSMR